MSIPKLSEAIRLGIGLFPQGCKWANCTLGTALAAIGRNWCHNRQFTEMPFNAAVKAWPWLKMRQTPNDADSTWYLTIQAMNGWDTVKQSREQIADFIETIEPQLEPQAAPQEVAHVETR